MAEDIRVTKTKNVYWQYVRAICIICVVLIHCKTGIGYKDSGSESWNFHYWLIMRQFINFPVAIFVFLSGYFINIKTFSKTNIKDSFTGGGDFLDS